VGYKKVGESFTLGPDEEAIAVSDSYLGFFPELLYDRIVRKLSEEQHQRKFQFFRSLPFLKQTSLKLKR